MLWYSLHKAKIIHRDLKTENIFVSDGICKIGDLGLCKDNKLDYTCVVGNDFYKAPEV